MSRVPTYPFRVVVTKMVGTNQQLIENHNYTSLAGAIAYREIALRKRMTKRVEVLMVLDESTPSHKD
jgi:hypothetical protein